MKPLARGAAIIISLLSVVASTLAWAVKNLTTVKNLTIITVLVVSIIVNFPLLLSSSVAVAQSSSASIPVYEITTRDVILGVEGGKGKGYDSKPLSDVQNLNKICYNETAIFVHGWDVNETEARERFDRVKMSLENQSYSIPLIGLSWHSDTEWLAAQFIAKWNGPLLADFITKLMNDCKQSQQKDIKIRLIGHSLGARVILSALDSLHKNEIWNERNFKITSVHLMGAAVDNEEVSMSPRDISDDKTNWGSPKSDYGEAIQEEVVIFTNLYSPQDNVLEPNLNYALQIYPSFEGDQALGQTGSQKIFPTNIATPKNYKDMNVQDQIVVMRDADEIDITATRDADGAEAEVFDLCNYFKRFCEVKSQGWDFGLCDFSNVTTVPCKVEIGDNHAGYIGFRDPKNHSSLAANGAIDIVVREWRAAP